MIHSIRLDNLLSFASGNPTLPLQKLNVFIGTNGAGKSNLIEALDLVRATPRSPSNNDFQRVISRGGTIMEWIWKGSPDTPATIELIMDNPYNSHTNEKQPIRHLFSFKGEQQRVIFVDEIIENESPYHSNNEPYFYYRSYNGKPVINSAIAGERKLQRDSINEELSILAQRRDPEQYPEITKLAEIYEEFRLYREWTFGRNTIFRNPQRSDLRNDRLEEDFSNKGLFLNRLKTHKPKAKTAILEGLKDLYQGIDDFNISIEGGTVQVFFTEGEFSIPATRLSDGTLRYLCLLALLCDPEPPPLLCIEEPELGLHPDIIPKLADLLIDASQRTQIIVTTHSDILIDALTEIPESVVVCEKNEGKTTMQRLNSNDLAEWLKHYRLGQLWTRGDIGGTRW
uniref:ATPase AAA-type core domain-containing protein n=1 Tax=Chlorobium chlorochromatii (strain CaD3) TaxID=340177 RepID=Q3AT14_CHLCH